MCRQGGVFVSLAVKVSSVQILLCSFLLMLMRKDKRSLGQLDHPCGFNLPSIVVHSGCFDHRSSL